MAGTTIVRHVTEAILGILRHDLAVVPVTPIIPSGSIKAAPPEDIETITSETLILYLYQVIESPFLKNTGPRVTGTAPDFMIKSDALALDLYYLLIPGAPTTPDGAFLDTYDILGAAMRSLHDHGNFTLGDWIAMGLTGEDARLRFRIAFNRLETGDLIRIWEAVQRPYRLSVSYVVRTVQIDSQLVTDTRLVSERAITIDQQ
jgi:hypothetical protein